MTAHHSRRWRRCSWWEAEPAGTEGAAGNRWPFLSASLPRNIAQSQRGDNAFTAPTGRLKPIGRPVEKPVVTGHLGRRWRRLYLGRVCGRVKPATTRVVEEKHSDKMKVTGSHCKCCCRGLAWLLWWRTAVVEGDAPKASSERPSLDRHPTFGLFPFLVFKGSPPSRRCIAALCQMKMWNNPNRVWKRCVRPLKSLKKKRI